MPEYPIPDEGEPFLLRYLVTAVIVPGEDLVLRLFSNDYIPARDSTLASYVTATFGGYSDRVLPRASGWDAPTVEGHVGVVRRTNPEVWTVASNPQTLYGAILFGGTSLKVYYQRRFAEPLVKGIGEAIAVRATITLQPLPAA